MPLPQILQHLRIPVIAAPNDVVTKIHAYGTVAARQRLQIN